MEIIPDTRFMKKEVFDLVSVIVAIIMELVWLEFVVQLFRDVNDDVAKPKIYLNLTI